MLGYSGTVAIDLAQWYFGRITHVAASLGTFGNADTKREHAAAPDTAHLLVCYADGAQGTIVSSDVSWLGHMDVRVSFAGSDGALELDQHGLFATDPGALRGSKSGEEPPHQTLSTGQEGWGAPSSADEPVLARILRLYTTQPVATRLFIDNIIAGKPGQPSFTDALRNELVVESARSDDWVEPGELAG